MKPHVYIEALDLVKKHHGTSGQTALAKCILSLYNYDHAFSIGEVLASLDEQYTRVVLGLVRAYAVDGETEALREAGSYVYREFPRLVELSNAMREARIEVRRKWEAEREARAAEDNDA